MKPSSQVASISLFLFFILIYGGCASTLPAEHHSVYSFPEKGVYVDLPTGADASRKYKPLGWVKAREHWPTMEQEPNNPRLCKNYYNKAVTSLLKEAQKVDADAVIQVRSVVLLLTGKVEEHRTPECSDDGAEGEILLKGIAIRYLPTPTPSP